ncbi:ATP-binding protein [Natroniella sulfidigena]|uniref:ATP-binding protein n=1 Tax=Natroniella sulfidigena TaxID=723921 RepID=UPI00200A4E57|nr:ATP-binding protein [Natroniella sulfidigena]MCK8817761.1 ATP-binding protein [Natroniella sulfidigena]
MKVEKFLNRLETNLQQKKSEYDRRQGRKEQLLEVKQQKKDDLEQVRVDRDLLDKVNILLQETSEYAREQAKQQIEALVTQALQYVFGDEFSFEIELKESRNQPAAEFYVVSQRGDYKLRNKPQDARGGGVVDVVSLALRVAILQSYQHPPLAGPLVLDEPAKHVSEEYIVNVTQFLKKVSEMFDRQVIVVTHQRHLTQVADRSFKVELIGEESQLTTDIIS